MSFAQWLRKSLASRPYKVEGDSMLPTLATGQYVLLTPCRHSWDRLSRGAIVVLKHPMRHDDIYIKRIVGLPNEDILLKDGLVYLNGSRLNETYARLSPTEEGQEQWEWWTGPDEYFVMGDNRGASQDSRAFGPVNQQSILGLVWFRYWPLRAWGSLANI